MVGASKILTVSYGTFSCTLEGFDDPFNTMKAIAEYFRDLAAGDRFFGATPPTPDADMLHRIAQREVQQRVEARVSEHGIVLRASDGDAEDTAPAPAPAPSAVAMPAATSAGALAAAAAVAEAAAPEADEPDLAEDATLAEEETVFAPAAEERPAPEPAARADDDLGDVAAKLSRIRAVIAAAQAAKAPAAPAADEAVFEDRAEIRAAASSVFEEEAAESVGFDTEDEIAGAINDDFGFELELDEFPVARHAEASRTTAESVGADAGAGEPAVESAPEIVADVEAPASDTAPEPVEDVAEATAEIEEVVAKIEEMRSGAESDAGALEPAVAEAAIEVEDIEDLTGEETAAEVEADTETGDLAGDAFFEDELAEERLEDEDYAALAVATLMGADGTAPTAEAAEDAEAVEDAELAGEDAALDALDLAGWRVETTAAEEDDAARAEEDAFEQEDEDLVAGEVAADETSAGEGPAEATPLDLAGEPTDEIEPAHEEPVAERRPSFFERARARVIRIGRAAAPAAAEAPAPAEAAGTPVEAVEAGAAEVASSAADRAEDEAEPADRPAEAEHAAIFAALHADDEDDAFDGETFAEDEDERADEDEDTFDEDEDDDTFDEAFDEDADVVETDAFETAADEREDTILAGIGAAISASQADAEEDEALSRELSALARDARRDAHEGRAILEDQAGDGEASVERLMEEAKSKLEGDESRRRFSAIAHLKAAVAATVADRKLKPQELPTETAGTPDEEIDRYREDLSKAVRPRRPVAEGAPATRRPALNERPVPLVLVSEQRVDIPADEVRHAAAVRPRRIGAAAFSISEVEDDEDDEAPLSPEEARSFAEFADRLGATDLAELLEAAAAYTATVEGLPHFSRPQILKKVANLAEDEQFSREDGLRSFGMLLRQGKIQKISRGQFMITEASRFMSEARRAAR